MKINQIRNLLYRIASLLGDYNAIRKGKIAERIARKTAGQMTGKTLNKIFRSIFK